jgi:hypothetical protein
VSDFDIRAPVLSSVDSGCLISHFSRVWLIVSKIQELHLMY